MLRVGLWRAERMEYTMHSKGEVIILEWKEKEKDLGVKVDSRLTLDNEIDVRATKANSIMGLIRRRITYLDQAMFTNLYTTLLRPYLEYAAPIWSPHLIRNINNLEKVQ